MLTYLQLENLKERIEEESEKKSDGLKALSKAQAEIQLWKSKFETEGLGRIDELESGKIKLNARLAEAEETIENLNQKVGSTEKTKHRLETELEDLQLEYERVHAAAIITEKRGRNFDKVIGEWKAKVDDLTSETEASHKECRNYNSELFRLKAAWDETTQQLDIVKRENKNLADEIKDLLDQLGDGGRSIHELDKQRRRLEVEKEELQAALEEAEAALEQEENKVLRAQLELGQVRQEIDRKILEKVEEFENTRYIFKFYLIIRFKLYIFDWIKLDLSFTYIFSFIGKTISVLWILCQPLWRLKLEPRLRLFVSRKSLSLTLMNLKLHLTTQTRLTLRLTSPSRDTKLNFVRWRVSMKRRAANAAR